ncbi:dihydrofolate reductase family protein [Maribacter dokdonensis]|uniref:dihydrofolate reductase family protein n=1 Tax=Maribacter dokdonensis TaxID=320912 RepID=UPI00293D23A8|nr:dihydrofolate reductase family protein [Maribacter dokdonensis]
MTLPFKLIYHSKYSIFKLRTKHTSRDRWQQGGGEFAGWLLDNGLIDQMKIKLNPIILGNGIPLFGNSTTRAKWNLIKTESFDEGLKILTYEIES